ncbi:MAG: GNAT family N-acetyltransferase, partial [Bacilli bacterium]
FPGAHEHYVVHVMRNHPDYIKELSFVIEVDGEIAGAIYYTKSTIVAPDKTIHPTVSFGPVFIAPKYHRQGLGRQLITHSIEAARQMGHRAILTLGYPYHYEPYGFKGGKKYNISMPDGLFYQGLLVLPLADGALDNIAGYAVFSDVFEVTNEDVDAFDTQFPPKEKKVQNSQIEYEQAVGLLDM